MEYIDQINSMIKNNMCLNVDGTCFSSPEKIEEQNMKCDERINNQQGLYNPEFEHDSCGVGFVANIKGVKSHQVIRDGIELLENLKHRGAAGSDPDTGDGAGIMVQVPDRFLRTKCDELEIDLPEPGHYGVGMIFLPPLSEDRYIIENIFEHIINEEAQEFLGFRDVPVNENVIGKVARSVMPVFKQIFIGKGEDTDIKDFERKLLIIRKKMGLEIRTTELSQKPFFYICSLSSKVLIYKGQLKAEQLDSFFPDLQSPMFESAISLVHSRYSTNTFPTWALAHPFRMIAHNGEINTLRGNTTWFNVREGMFESDIFGEDLKKIYPVIAPSKSDSAAFDNALEMLVFSGRSLPHAVMMMIPEAFTGDKNMDDDKKAFYRFHSCLMEPWDGPATISFCDGRYIGSVLDRNGLRPSRYWVTKDDRVIMASETGALDVAPQNVLKKGRLQPGKIFFVDTEEGRIIEDDEIKNKTIHQKPYGKWLQENLIEIDSLPEVDASQSPLEDDLLKKQRTFGYTLEDLKLLFPPMALDGHEATGSMGADIPLAVLSDKPQLLFNYFKQLFAQVTNPPIDAIREEVIMSEEVMLGAELNLLTESPEHCKRLKLNRPVISNENFAKIKKIKAEGLKPIVIPMLFDKSFGELGLKQGLKELFTKSDNAISQGYSLIILSDRGVSKSKAPIPSLLASAGLHHHLIRNGTRTKVSIIVETGEAREVHHFAVLIGYGVNAVNPYLAFETIKQQIENNLFEKEISYEKAVENYLKAVSKGLYKIISKMGISTIQSYCGAQIFEAVGLGKEIINEYFNATPSRLKGIGLKEIAKETLMRHEPAYNSNVDDSMLDEGGFYQWREKSEFHQWNPETIALLQHAVRTNDYKIYKQFSDKVNSNNGNHYTLRSLLKFRKRKPIPIEEVEPATEIVKRFATGAMSYGSISKEAHETLAIAMNRLGGFSNTGEGGEDPERFKVDENGNLKKSRIKQIAQGRFGVTIEYLVNADQLQIKMAQGAKPGEGGQLPGHKVSKDIAKTRYTTPGVGLISPPPHHDIYSIEDLAQLIFDLKNSNIDADVSVKLVSEMGVGTIAAGVSKGKADHLLISGYEGGTGASPQTSIKHAGLPIEMGLAEVQQVLIMNDLRRRIRIQADGQLKNGRDVVIAALLGADEFGFATAPLISLGCIMLRKCHLNTCSVGIATQDEKLRQMFSGKPEHVVNYFMFIAEEVREIMASLGIKSFDKLIGKTELLEQKRNIEHWKAKHLDLTNILHRPDTPYRMPLYNSEKQVHKLGNILDKELINLCKKAISNKIPAHFSYPIKNTDRATGTMLSSEIAKRYGLEGLPDDTIQVYFDGSAGQSFGAFLAKGITLHLEGDSNDYIGKGLSGGKIIVGIQPNSTLIPRENILIGNVALYGAIAGEAFFNGIAGERFAVRNSGASAVVEGVGDHGCEYMTGGRVVILGPTGRNFAAGMSGGIAYIYDKAKTFEKNCNMEMVELFDIEQQEDIKELQSLIEKHFVYTKSETAESILKNWETELKYFVKVFPVDYRKVLEAEAKERNTLRENIKKVTNTITQAKQDSA